MIVRELFAKLGVQTDPASQKQAESGMDRLIKFAKAAAVAFAAIKTVGFFKGIAEQTAALGDNIDKTSQRIGVSAQALQELSFAANLAGASQQDVATALRVLQKNMLEAAQGSKSFQEDFARLGVSVKDSNGNLKSAEELLPELGDGLKNLKSSTERTALAQTLLGRSGTTLIPLFTQGTAAIQEQREEARKLGGVLDKEMIQLSVVWTDQSFRLSQAIQGVKNIIAKALLPAMTQIVDVMIDWVKNNQDLIRQTLGRVLKGAARVVASIAKLIARVVVGIQEWIAGFDPLTKKFLILTGVAAALAAILLLPGGSIILLGILIGLLIDDFVAWQEGGESVIGALIEAFDTFLMRFPVLRAVLITLKDFFVGWFDALTSLVSAFFQFWFDLFEVGFLEAVRMFGERYIDIWKNIWSKVREPVIAFFDWLSNLAPFKALSGLITKLLGEEPTLETEVVVLRRTEGPEEGAAALETGPPGQRRELARPGEGTVLAPAPAVPAAIAAPRPAVQTLTEGLRAARRLPAAVAPVASGLQFAAQAPVAVGVGAGGVAPVRAGGASVVNQPTTNVDVTVKGTPGMDERRLAQEVAKQTADAIDNQNRATLQALVPAAAEG